MTNEEEHRNLAAIMFTDRVGYSAPRQRNEALALLHEQPYLKGRHAAATFTDYGAAILRQQMAEAFAALAKAEAQRSYYVGWWKVDPELDRRRSDPRFSALLKKVGLAP